MSYGLIGIPITKTGSTSKKSFSYNDTLKLDGDIVAGKGNSKYMKINRDGSIDISTSGFYSDEYTLINEQKLSPEELKEKEKIDLDIDLKEVTTELTLLDGNLSEINAKLQDIETQITENTSVLTKFENYDFKSENNLSSEVLTSFKELLLGSGDKITEEQYSKILTSYKNECAEIEARNQEKYAKGVQEGYEDVPSIDEYLENKYAEFGLSQAQLKTINDACDIEGALFNIVEIGGLDYCLYNGKDGKEYIIVGEDSNPKKVISDELETLQKIKDEYKDIQTNYKSKIAILNEKKKDIESDILALDNKSYNVDNYLYAILFNGIKNQSSYVDIYINKNSDIQGSGNIRVASPGVKIDNYSNRNLLFLDVDLDATYKNGLNINDYNYNVFQDKAVAINNDKAEAYIMKQEGTFDGLPTSGVHYLSHEATNGKTDVPTGFTINNYYDNSNPFAPSKEASSIFFLSSVYSNSGLNIWNESGDVIFCDLLNTTNAKILSTQGALSFLSINEDVNFKLNGDNNYFYAGKGIGIKAKNIDISNIKMVAGTSSRTVTITEDMLNNLIEDPTTGEINMINLGGEISPYLNAVNNIKAVYKDGQIYLFDIAQTDGTIKLETSGNLNLSNVSDMYKTSEGYQTIAINNKTSTPINIGKISNLKFDGEISHNGTRITDIGTNTKLDSASTRIDSNGLLTINEPILNNLVYNEIEKTYSSENKNGELLINSKNGLKINKISEIRNSGNLSIKNEDKEMQIQGAIYNTGDITIDKYGSGDSLIVAIINNTDGNINMYNSENGDFTITNEALIFLNKDTNPLLEGNINITNRSNTIGNLVILSELINYGQGDVNILVDEGSTSSLDINKNVTANIGNVSIINKGTKGITINDSKISTTKGNIIITRDGLAEGVTINSDSEILADKGQIVVTNNGNGGVNISGAVTNNEGDTTVSNTGSGLINIIGSIFNKKGTQSLSNTNTDLTSGIVVATNGTLTNEDGNIQITNKGGKGTAINGNVKSDKGSISLENTHGATNISGNVTADKGQIVVTNNGNSGVNISGAVTNNEGDTTVSNTGSGLINIIGSIFNKKGTQSLSNTNTDLTSGIVVATNGTLTNEDGNIQITNKGGKGTAINGNVKSDIKDITITNSASDIVIGEYDSDNDNYLQANNVIINQTNGNIKNGILDEIEAVHSNHDLGNPNKSYKTLISTTGNLELNVVDGNIGESNLDNPAFSIDAKTRDYTDSINVNIGGTLSAKALNQNLQEKRLVNIRAKDSDLNIQNVTSDGDVILTAGDWHQADTKPTPSSDEYYTGYSILNAAENNNSAIYGQNVSVIASNKVGTTDKSLSITQDTLYAPNSSISVEAESDVNLTVNANSDDLAKLYQLISKRGNLNLLLNADAEIASITSDKILHILSTGKKLTIYEIGTSDSIGSKFNDMLYPHDNIEANSNGGGIPEAIDIEVLDSYGGDNANSTLKVYSAMVKGRNNGQGIYYEEDGSRKDDVFLMADNIYANSYLAPDSVNSAREYSDVVFGGEGSNIIKAKGINAVGNGVELALDVRGVNKDVVNIVSPDATRTNYKTQEQVQSPISKFLNDYAIITEDCVDYRANNVAISINDIVGQDRNVRVNTLISDEAYINTLSNKMGIYEGYINNYAEFRNNSKFVIIDNLNRHLYDKASAQLYTEKTGSFNLFMDETINIHTSAGTVWNNPHLLVNGYHSAWSFVNRAQKECKNQYDRLDMKNNKMPEEQIRIKALVTGIDVLPHSNISDIEIVNISYKGALLKTKSKMLLSKIYDITFYLEDTEKYTLKVKVISSDEGLTRVEFIDATEDIINKIMYRNMLKANL